MKLAFSSLACMEWPLEKVAAEAKKYGYDGVELRGKEYRHLDPAMDSDQRRKVRDLFAASGLEIPCVTAYTRLTMADPEERKKSVATLKDQIQLAADLGARFVRTFGGPIPAGVEIPDCLDYVAASLREVGEWAADHGVEVLLETHDDFSLSERVAEVMKKVDHPNVGVLWDVLHPVRFGETPEETFARIGKHVRFVHVKDARRAGIGEYWPLTLLGRGEAPLERIVEVLRQNGYDDYLCFEWEKPWHPEIEETEVALPHAAGVMKQLTRRGTADPVLPDTGGAAYRVRSYAFQMEQFIPRGLFDLITDIRVSRPEIIREEAAARRQRERLTLDGKLAILACDHPARFVTRVGDDPLAMGDRWSYLGRILRVMTCPEIDGVMATPDIIDDLFIVNYLYKQVNGKGFLDDKVLLGCMNRGGLAGTEFELDDRMTAYTAERMREMKLDGAKIMFRLDPRERDSGRTIAYCAGAITQCNRLDLPVFLEPLPVSRTEKGFTVQMTAADLVKVAGVASALGDSSSGLWLKVPYVPGFEAVARSTTLPILMLGGEASGDPTTILADFESGMKAGKNVRGALVGRNVLYPGVDDPFAVAAAVAKVVHASYSPADAVAYLMSVRDSDPFGVGAGVALTAVSKEQ